MTNPTESEIEKALGDHMDALTPAWRSKLPGVAFTPTGGPWQRGTWMPARPGLVAFGGGAHHRQSGVYQIDIFYPKSERRVDLLLERATAMRQHFYPDGARGLTIEAGEGEIIVERRPGVSGIDETDPAYNRVFVEVFVRIELRPAA